MSQADPAEGLNMDTNSAPIPLGRAQMASSASAEHAILTDEVETAIRIAAAAGSKATLDTLRNPGNMEFINQCMHSNNCDTGSQLRKAVSHVFGRNKACTRSIPSHVWVYYCRKHYQRSRYRYGIEYVRVQSELVHSQIHRIQAWSDGNKNRGQGPVVTGWTLSIRKREQKRLDEKRANSRKRGRSDSDDEEDVDEDDGAYDAAIANGTAVPDWLLDHCGAGCSSQEILEIWENLKASIYSGSMSQIPDIEILPEIEEASKDDSKPNKAAKTRQESTAGVRTRSQSLSSCGFGIDSTFSPQGVAFGSMWDSNVAGGSSGFVARQQTRDQSSNGPSMGVQSNWQGLFQQGTPAPTYNMAYHPAMSGAGNINSRNPYASSQYHALGQQYTAVSASGQNGLLPAPVPQNVGAASTVRQLEYNTASNFSASVHNQAHQRAYSEAVAPSGRPYPVNGPSSSGYGQQSADSNHGHIGGIDGYQNPFGFYGGYYARNSSPYAYPIVPFTATGQYGTASTGSSYDYGSPEIYHPRQVPASAAEELRRYSEGYAETCNEQTTRSYNAGGMTTASSSYAPSARSAYPADLPQEGHAPSTANSARIHEDEKTKAIYSERRG